MTTPKAGSPEASAAIWRWRVAESPPESGPRPSRLRVQGTLQAAVGAGFGLLCFLFWSRTIAIVAFSMAGTLLLAALLSPTGLYALLRRLLDATGRGVGRVMTWIVMVPIFYGLFLPFGKLMRRGRRDRLKRYFDAEASSYWEPHQVMATSTRERQY